MARLVASHPNPNECSPPSPTSTSYLCYAFLVHDLLTDVSLS